MFVLFQALHFSKPISDLVAQAAQGGCSDVRTSGWEVRVSFIFCSGSCCLDHTESQSTTVQGCCRFRFSRARDCHKQKKNPILILKNIRKGYVGHIQLHVTTGTFNIRDLQSIYYTHHDTWSLQSMSQDLQCEAKSCKIQNATEEGREGYCQHQLLVTAG